MEKKVALSPLSKIGSETHFKIMMFGILSFDLFNKLRTLQLADFDTVRRL